MKLKIKTGQSITNDQGFEITNATGRLENLTYAHIAGVMSDPENLDIHIRAKVRFYAEDVISGDLQSCYEIKISKNVPESLEMLTGTASGTLVFNVIENAIYNHIVNLDEYKDILEIVS